jgi:hypothetical protein
MAQLTDVFDPGRPPVDVTVLESALPDWETSTEVYRILDAELDTYSTGWLYSSGSIVFLCQTPAQWWALVDQLRRGHAYRLTGCADPWLFDVVWTVETMTTDRLGEAPSSPRRVTVTYAQVVATPPAPLP